MSSSSLCLAITVLICRRQMTQPDDKTMSNTKHIFNFPYSNLPKSVGRQPCARAISVGLVPNYVQTQANDLTSLLPLYPHMEHDSFQPKGQGLQRKL